MAVEIILKTKVEGLGAEADIVSVKPGYARNFLIPQNFAAPSTTATKRQIEELKRKRAEREAEELNQANEQATKLGKLKLTFTLTAGEGQEKVFGSVTAQDIADKVKELGHEIDRKKINLPKPIKETGSHQVILNLHHGIEAKLQVEIISSQKSDEKTETSEAPKAAKKGKSKSKKE